MKRPVMIGCVCMIIPCVVFAGESQRPRTIVEVSKSKPPSPLIGTSFYEPTKVEAPFRERVPRPQLDPHDVDQMPAAVPQTARPTTAPGKAQHAPTTRSASQVDQLGKYVGWFGIVRDISTDGARSELIVEHKYFDGLSDLDLQVVSIYGAGDFKAVLSDKPENIPMLGLVAVYGNVSVGADHIPTVTAEYVRVWDWGLFTFMEYGTDRSNPKWVRLRMVSSGNFYRPNPTKAFYEARLGKRRENRSE